MRDLVRRFIREESGQDLAEYGIALLVVALGAAAAAIAIAGNVSTLWTTASAAVAAAVAGI